MSAGSIREERARPTEKVPFVIMNKKADPILIAGGGCAGLSLAIHLVEQRGFDHTILLVESRVFEPRITDLAVSPQENGTLGCAEPIPARTARDQSDTRTSLSVQAIITNIVCVDSSKIHA